MIEMTIRSVRSSQDHDGTLVEAIDQNIDWIKRCFEREHGQWRQSLTEISVKKSMISGGSATYDVFTKTSGVSPRVARMTIAVKAEYKHPITKERIEQSLDVDVIAPESEFIPVGTVLYSNNADPCLSRANNA